VHVRDLVRRDFTATAPNRLWLTDITLVPTGQGRLRAAVILDAYNREVISWAVDQRERPTTALRALTQAIRLRQPAPGCVIHSDRGYQFTAHDWLGTIEAAGLSASIGERHSALDNAMMESWFASFKN
jgi:putative transposase